MRYVAAYLLAVLGGKDSPAAGDIEKILSSVGIEVDSARLSQVVAQLKGKSIDELIKEGREKLSAMPVGGGAAAVSTAAGAPAAAAEEKKAEKSKFCFHNLTTLNENYDEHHSITIFRMNQCDSETNLKKLNLKRSNFHSPNDM